MGLDDVDGANGSGEDGNEDGSSASSAAWRIDGVRDVVELHVTLDGDVWCWTGSGRRR